MTRLPVRMAFTVLSLAVLGLIAMRLSAEEAPPAKAAEVQTADYKVTGPIVHDNLAVYLIHGPDQPGAKHYLTLQEGLDRKIITVVETGDVNRLEIVNTSDTIEVYIQSGDIVKGGRQDRTIAMDFICPPKSKLPIDAFCVEHGRWSQRAGESSANFSSSNSQLAGNALKVAAKGANSQGEVWNQVATFQTKAGRNVGVTVNAAESASSLQLSLENAKLQEMTEAYVKEMATVAELPDVVGYAFAINGKMRSGDLYGSHELFAKLWPKAMRATAVEAVAYRQKDKPFTPPAADAVTAAMLDADGGKPAEQKVTDRVKMITRESEANLLYETRDRDAGVARAADPAAAPATALTGAWIHRNYLAKDEETKAALAAGRASGSLQLQGSDTNRINTGNLIHLDPVPATQPAPGVLVR